MIYFELITCVIFKNIKVGLKKKKKFYSIFILVLILILFIFKNNKINLISNSFIFNFLNNECKINSLS